MNMGENNKESEMDKPENNVVRQRLRTVIESSMSGFNFRRKFKSTLILMIFIITVLLMALLIENGLSFVNILSAPNFFQKKENAVLSIMKVFNSQNIPLIIFDADIFENLTYINEIAMFQMLNRFKKKLNNFQTLKFATLASSFNEKQSFLEDYFEKLEYSVAVISNSELWDPESQVKASHFIISKERYRMEITLLKELQSKCLWHHSPSNTPSLISHDSNIRISNRMNLQKLKFDEYHVTYPTNVSEYHGDMLTNIFIPCNYTRSVQFYKNFPEDVSKKAEYFKHRVLTILLKAKEILDRLNIPFWLSSGTFLGFFRQCDVIAHSFDVDIGIFIDDYKPSLIHEFVSADLTLIQVFGKESDSYELSFKYMGVKLDIFFFYKEDNYMWNGGLRAHNGQKLKYAFPKFNLCWTLFKKMAVRIPCPPTQYIEANYGKDWFTQNKGWDWSRSPPNVRENGYWPRKLWPEVIQMGSHIKVL